MINEQGGHKVLEIFNIEHLWSRLEKEFKLPMVARSVEFQTPRGTFTVQLITSERNTREVALFYDRVHFTYHNPDCHHDHEGKEVDVAKGIGQFCKSNVKVTYKDPSSFDPSIAARIDTFVKKCNELYSQGVTWLNPGDYPGVSSFADTTISGSLKMSKPVILSD